MRLLVRSLLPEVLQGYIAQCKSVDSTAGDLRKVERCTHTHTLNYDAIVGTNTALAPYVGALDVGAAT